MWIKLDNKIWNFELNTYLVIEEILAAKKVFKINKYIFNPMSEIRWNIYTIFQSTDKKLCLNVLEKIACRLVKDIEYDVIDTNNL